MTPGHRSLFVALSLTIGIGAAQAGAQAAIPHLYFPTADAKAELGRALERAKTKKHLVMIVFGSDWCVDCWVLDTMMHHPNVAPVVHDHYEVVKVDIGQGDLNMDLDKKYGDPISSGVPALVILDPKGTMIASTRDKPWENARAMKVDGVRDQLKAWTLALRKEP